MRRIYLDNGSTSYPKAPGVADAMSDYITYSGCNINRGSYNEAYDVGEKVLETRMLICDLFGYDKPKNVVFTPGVTYSINCLLMGLLRPGDHIVITGMEHNAVARPCEVLRSKGVEVSVAPCTQNGKVSIDNFKKLFKHNTKLVMAIHASNVCGAITDLESIGKMCRDAGVYFAVDAAQSAGVVNIDFTKLNLSALCIAGHKGLLGPQGIGAMILTDTIAEEMNPLISGGTGSESNLLTMPRFMPDKFEAGTLNIPGIMGLNIALKYIIKVGTKEILHHERKLSELFIKCIGSIGGIRVIGPESMLDRTGVVSLDFTCIDNAEMAFLLESEFGIMTRCGLHCAPLAHKSLGTFPQGTVRFSFGYSTTEADVIYTVDSIGNIIDNL